MSESLNNYTNEQRAYTATRIIHDAELLRGGAGISADLSIKPTAEQEERMRFENISDSQIEEFYETTIEGQAIRGHIDGLDRFKAAINYELGNAVALRRHGSVGRAEDYKAFAQSNNLDVNFDRLSGTGPQAEHDRGEYLKLLNQRDFHKPLHDLTLNLIDKPQYRFGSEVTVLRNPRGGAPARYESGWEIRRILADGELVVTNGGDLEKDVTVDQLLDWQDGAQQDAVVFKNNNETN